ncbi:MAG: hypothetical protein E6898_01450 [Corynebacterium sp.]|uniref:hypothetical protein n=1 Tax=unclassified Corynebacterium TaxID=2624378 RepID=UPI00257CD91D|nr:MULTISPECIES: hypothetical protein [unclassified Corynebacterium]MDU1461391.1 hypothetical protein [Corynebacterium sp.]
MMEEKEVWETRYRFLEDSLEFLIRALAGVETENDINDRSKILQLEKYIADSKQLQVCCVAEGGPYIYEFAFCKGSELLDKQSSVRNSALTPTDADRVVVTLLSTDTEGTVIDGAEFDLVKEGQ